MALKGNLQDFSITQLLNLINLARKTGSLTVKSNEGVAELFFREGKLIYATMIGQDGHLTSMLVKSGKLTPEHAKAIQARTEVKGDKQLAVLLINAGYVSQKDIIQGVTKHMLDIVYRLFTWTEGQFYFDPNRHPDADRITVPIALENIIIEGSRRMKEWERLQDELPDLDMALRFTERPDAKLRNINLSVDEWRVISFINPRNTIRQIAQANNMSDFQIRKIVYGMLQAGLVELVVPEGRPKTTLPDGRPRPKAPAVKRSVVNRLIERIKRL